MPTSPPQLQFLRLPGYQTQPVPGSTLLYTIDSNRPIGYSQPTKLLIPTLPNTGVWRAASRDTSIDVADLVATDLGVYMVLADAQTACQDDANMNGLNWTLVWLGNASFESRPVPQFQWIYDISQPSPDVTGAIYWRAAKRDATLPDSFQEASILGNFLAVADAMVACQNDFAVTFPSIPVSS